MTEEEEEEEEAAASEAGTDTSAADRMPRNTDTTPVGVAAAASAARRHMQHRLSHASPADGATGVAPALASASASPLATPQASLDPELAALFPATAARLARPHAQAEQSPDAADSLLASAVSAVPKLAAAAERARSLSSTPLTRSPAPSLGGRSVAGATPATSTAPTAAAAAAPSPVALVAAMLAEAHSRMEFRSLEEQRGADMILSAVLDEHFSKLLGTPRGYYLTPAPAPRPAAATPAPVADAAKADEVPAAQLQQPVAADLAAAFDQAAETVAAIPEAAPAAEVQEQAVAVAPVAAPLAAEPVAVKPAPVEEVQEVQVTPVRPPLPPPPPPRDELGEVLQLIMQQRSDIISSALDAVHRAAATPAAPAPASKPAPAPVMPAVAPELPEQPQLQPLPRMPGVASAPGSAMPSAGGAAATPAPVVASVGGALPVGLPRSRIPPAPGVTGSPQQEVPAAAAAAAPLPEPFAASPTTVELTAGLAPQLTGSSADSADGGPPQRHPADAALLAELPHVLSVLTVPATSVGHAPPPQPLMPYQEADGGESGRTSYNTSLAGSYRALPLSGVPQNNASATSSTAGAFRRSASHTGAPLPPPAPAPAPVPRALPSSGGVGLIPADEAAMVMAARASLTAPNAPGSSHSLGGATVQRTSAPTTSAGGMSATSAPAAVSAPRAAGRPPLPALPSPAAESAASGVDLSHLIDDDDSELAASRNASVAGSVAGMPSPSASGFSTTSLGGASSIAGVAQNPFLLGGSGAPASAPTAQAAAPAGTAPAPQLPPASDTSSEASMASYTRGILVYAGRESEAGGVVLPEPVAPAASASASAGGAAAVAVAASTVGSMGGASVASAALSDDVLAGGAFRYNPVYEHSAAGAASLGGATTATGPAGHPFGFSVGGAVGGYGYASESRDSSVAGAGAGATGPAPPVGLSRGNSTTSRTGGLTSLEHEHAYTPLAQAATAAAAGGIGASDGGASSALSARLLSAGGTTTAVLDPNPAFDLHPDDLKSASTSSAAVAANAASGASGSRLELTLSGGVSGGGATPQQAAIYPRLHLDFDTQAQEGAGLLDESLGALGLSIDSATPEEAEAAALDALAEAFGGAPASPSSTLPLTPIGAPDPEEVRPPAAAGAAASVVSGRSLSSMPLAVPSPSWGNSVGGFDEHSRELSSSSLLGTSGLTEAQLAMLAAAPELPGGSRPGSRILTQHLTALQQLQQAHAAAGGSGSAFTSAGGASSAYYSAVHSAAVSRAVSQAGGRLAVALPPAAPASAASPVPLPSTADTEEAATTSFDFEEISREAAAVADVLGTPERQEVDPLNATMRGARSARGSLAGPAGSRASSGAGAAPALALEALLPTPGFGTAAEGAAAPAVALPAVAAGPAEPVASGFEAPLGPLEAVTEDAEEPAVAPELAAPAPTAKRSGGGLVAAAIRRFEVGAASAASHAAEQQPSQALSQELFPSGPGSPKPVFKPASRTPSGIPRPPSSPGAMQGGMSPAASRSPSSASSAAGSRRNSETAEGFPTAPDGAAGTVATREWVPSESEEEAPAVQQPQQEPQQQQPARPASVAGAAAARPASPSPMRPQSSPGAAASPAGPQRATSGAAAMAMARNSAGRSGSPSPIATSQSRPGWNSSTVASPPVKRGSPATTTTAASGSHTTGGSPSPQQQPPLHEAVRAYRNMRRSQV